MTLLSVRGEADHPPTGGLYPHTFQMPSGRVLVAGPEPSDSWFFRLSDIGALSWEDAPNPTRHTFGSGVLLPGTPQGSTRVALIGGVGTGMRFPTPAPPPRCPIVETFDEANPAAGWTPAPPLNHGRAHHNTVQLPDGSMVTVGGGYGILNGEPAGRRPRHPSQHRDLRPRQRAMDPGARAGRAAHLPLHRAAPAGRAVMSAGDDGYGGSTNDTAEIYQPPYLFRGPRPQISLRAGPRSRMGKTFTVDTSTDATKAVLVAPAAVTHANDMSQRVVPLTSTVGPAGRMTITAPARPRARTADLLHALRAERDGVPSVAKFVRLKFGSPAGPPDTVISSGPPSATQATSARFEFHSDEQGATFRCRLDGGAAVPCASPWDYSGLAAGPHSFEVTAVDPAGTADPTPATRSWTVNTALPDSTAPETSYTYGPVSTSATTARFEFVSSEDGSSFACRLDSGAWGACVSPSNHSGLSQGAHTFAVRATDPAGNVDPTPAVWNWTVLAPSSMASGLSATPGATVLADSIPPLLKMAVKRRTGRVVVEVTCLNEACTATAGGRLVVPGAARAYKLRPASAQIAKGAKANLQLRFSKAASRKVRRALRKHRRVRARVVLTAKDFAGNTATSSRRLRLKG